jgi:hypothetical protein
MKLRRSPIDNNIHNTMISSNPIYTNHNNTSASKIKSRSLSLNNKDVIMQGINCIITDMNSFSLIDMIFISRNI